MPSNFQIDIENWENEDGKSRRGKKILAKCALKISEGRTCTKTTDLCKSEKRAKRTKEKKWSLITFTLNFIISFIMKATFSGWVPVSTGNFANNCSLLGKIYQDLGVYYAVIWGLYGNFDGQCTLTIHFMVIIKQCTWWFRWKLFGFHKLAWISLRAATAAASKNTITNRRYYSLELTEQQAEKTFILLFNNQTNLSNQTL